MVAPGPGVGAIYESPREIYPSSRGVASWPIWLIIQGWIFACSAASVSFDACSNSRAISARRGAASFSVRSRRLVMARAQKLSPEKRSEIAHAAAAARWGVPKATHQGELAIGDIRIPCAVLDDGRRVLTENGITNALLGSRSGASKRLKKTLSEAGAPAPLFLAPERLKPFISNEMLDGPLVPVQYLDGARTVYQSSVLLSFGAGVVVFGDASIVFSSPAFTICACRSFMKGSMVSFICSHCSLCFQAAICEAYVLSLAKTEINTESISPDPERLEALNRSTLDPIRWASLMIVKGCWHREQEE